MTETRESGADATRNSLIMAGLDLFGRHGFEGASTRNIAGAAKANIGSIAYHFGGKEGLRQACAEHVAGTMRGVVEPVLAGASAGVSDPDPETARRRSGAACARRS